MRDEEAYLVIVCASAPDGRALQFKAEAISLAVGDQVRIAKNFQSQGKRFRNNELHVVTGVTHDKLTLEKGEMILHVGLLRPILQPQGHAS